MLVLIIYSACTCKASRYRLLLSCVNTQFWSGSKADAVLTKLTENAHIHAAEKTSCLGFSWPRDKTGMLQRSPPLPWLPGFLCVCLLQEAVTLRKSTALHRRSFAIAVNVSGIASGVVMPLV